MPGCSAKKEGVVNSVVELGSSSVGLLVYRRKRGGRNNEYHVNRCISMHDKTSKMLGVP